MNTLNRLETVSGDYGLYIKIRYTDEIDTTALQEKTFNFSQNDMYGDVYNFTTYFSQEAVFDISGLGNITNIDAFLYQNSNFKKIKSTADGNDDYELIPSKIIEKNQKGEIVYTEEMEPNIFVDNIKISLGYDLNNFDNDAVIVYTLDSAQYSSSESAKAREREIQARWVHKTDDGFVSIFEQDLANYNAQIHWYRYQLDEKAKQDEFGGKYWVPIKDYSGKQYLDKNDNYKCYIECDPAVQDENIKAVISLPSAERNEYLQEVSVEFNKGELVPVKDIEGLIKALTEAPNKLTNDDVLMQIQLLIDTYKKIEEPNENEQKCLEYLNKINEEISGLPCIDLYSDIVQIHNTTQVQARLAVDLVQAVSITVGDEKDPYKGVYMIYGENGEIMNSSISAQRQKLILSYGSLLTGLNEFDGDGTELVSWRFPLTNTMIRTPTEGVEYNNENFDYNGDTIPAIRYVDDNGNAPTENSPATWAIISRKIEQLDETDQSKKTKIGDFAVKTTEQIFRIKDYYTSVGRNTIYCEINKGGYIYVAEITLIFGVAGTSGTDYTLRVVPSKTAISNNSTEGTTEISLNAHVYDYNNQEVEIKSIEYSFISPDSLNNDLGDKFKDFPVSFGDNGARTAGSQSGNITVKARVNDVYLKNYYVIIKVVARIEALGATELTTFFPLSWSQDLSKYNHFEGPDKIIYSVQGSNPFYYKSNFVLYNKLDEEVSKITWFLEVYDTFLNDKVKKFYPSVLVNNNLYSLKVPSMYIKENYLCRLVGKDEDKNIIWVQPLYIAQNAYNSSLLNNWDETVSVDEEGGTVMAPMIGAGKKNANNQFSGVLMGDVKKANNDVALTGLYGYQNGIQTFSLTEDGKAKFGASGSGQIQIDGNQGVIESGNYTVDKKTGMQIDLKEGYIDAYNFKLTSNYITINSSEDANNYFTVKGSGTVSSPVYVYSTDISDPKLEFGLDKTDETATTNVVGKTLMNIGNSSYYLQTLDYNSTDGKETGMRWDLTSGKLRAYGGFNLEAINHKVKVSSSGGDAEETNYPGIYVEVNMNHEAGDLYSIDRVNRYNYKNYYFRLNGETSDYHNDWDCFDEVPFSYDYVPAMDGIEYRKTGNNYTAIFEIYYFGYINEKQDPWNGDKSTLSQVKIWKKITKDNWKAENAYFKTNEIIGLDKTQLYKKDKVEKAIDKLFKKVDTKTYVLIGSTNTKLKVGILKQGQQNGTLYDYTITRGTNTDSTLSLSLETAKNYWYWDSDNKEFVHPNSVLYDKANDILTLKIAKKGLTEVYIDVGTFYKGTLSINADAGQYPLQLKLGNETPFKLSWAGYLYTTKLQATGGTIGSWYIDANGLWSDKSSPKIQINKTGTISISIPNNEAYTLTSSNKDYTGPHILVGGRSGKFIDKAYDSIGSGELTKHEEGKFDNEDIGKYIQKNGSYYKIMRTALDNTGSYYEQVYSGEGGIALTGDGTIAIENLYLKGGGGYWGGCAAYSTATTSTGHTHFLQGNVPVKRFKETSLRHYEKNTDGTIKLYALINHEYCVSGTYSGNTNSSLTFKLQGEYDYQETQGDTYYPRSQYSALEKKYNNAKANQYKWYYNSEYGFKRSNGRPVDIRIRRYGEDGLELVAFNA